MSSKGLMTPAHLRIQTQKVAPVYPCLTHLQNKLRKTLSKLPVTLGSLLPFSNNLAFYREQTILIKMLVVLSQTENAAPGDNTAQGPP